MVNICSILLVGMYLISSMGYGIHECMHKGTKDVVLLFGEIPCQCSHDGHEDEIDGKCCTTTTYTLSHKQLNPKELIEDFQVNHAMPLFTLFFNEVFETAGPFGGLVVKYPSGFKNITECVMQVLCKSQIRI